MRPRPSRPPRVSQRRRAARGGGALLLGAILFGLGVALGEALHDNPQPGGTITRTRVLKPLPLPPERRTVTVTTTAPRR